MSELPRLTAHRAVVLGLAASVAIIAAVFYVQYVMGLAPCELCLWQRKPHYAAIAVAGLTLVALAAGRIRTLAVPLVLMALLYLGAAGLGLLHVGVEQHWWPSPVGCSAGGDSTDPAAILNELLRAPIVACDAVAWSLFGISMAGYNVLVSLMLAGLMLAGLRSRR